MEGNLEATAGSYCTFNSQAIWKAKTEGKHRFFAWLLVQGRIQTADVLLPKGVQCNPICCLCDQEPEIAAHLCLYCCFAQEVWWQVHLWSDGLICTPSPSVDVEEWWNLSLRTANDENRSRIAAILIYTFWNVWNERTVVSSRGLHNLRHRFSVWSNKKWTFEDKRAREESLMYFLVKSSSMLFIYACNHNYCTNPNSSLSYMIRQRSCLYVQKK